jgi:fluoroquinolone transport system permease protein
LKRLAWSIYRDFRIQLRSGYPWLTMLTTGLCIFAFTRIPEGDSDVLAPFASLAFSCLTTLPFLIAQIAGERREGTLALLDLTPLRPHEYLASKAISLAIPSIPFNTVMVLISRGPYFNPFFFAAGLAVSGILFAWIAVALVGFAGNVGKAAWLAVPAAMLMLLPLHPDARQLPFPHYLIALHPLAGPAYLIRESYQERPLRDMVVAVAGSAFWMGLALAACRKAFARFRNLPVIAEA